VSEAGPSGPLVGVRVLELAGMGPAPFAGMLLADMGADVVRVSRPGEGRTRSQASIAGDTLTRSRRNITVDLRSAKGRALALRLIEQAAVLIEPFRPGVAERLGIGPDDCLAVNPSLVYARMTGWGQDGPLAQAAGHDINFVALSGALDKIGQAGGKPTIPLNLVGDFGGGGMLCVIGVLAALIEARVSSVGQVVDVSMLDGATALMSVFYGHLADPRYNGARGTNLLDGGAWFYDTYETSDGGFIALGAIEPDFCRQLTELIGLAPGTLPPQGDQTSWSDMKQRMTALIGTRTRDEWCQLLEGTDACVAPVLAPAEAPDHPHHRARRTFIEVDGVQQPAPVPRFSRTPGRVQAPPARPGSDTAAVLVDWLGLTPGAVDDVVEAVP
jgi:alpha-methylacyl-CoA racemase